MQGAAPPSEAGPVTAVDRAAREFESIFVRQLLEASHVGRSSGPYASMSVDAISKALADGGGLGLASTIARDIGRAESDVSRFG